MKKALIAAIALIITAVACAAMAIPAKAEERTYPVGYAGSIIEITLREDGTFLITDGLETGEGKYSESNGIITFEIVYEGTPEKWECALKDGIIIPYHESEINVISDMRHGKAEFSQEYGKEGDIVTISITPDILFIVTKVTVNGIELTESETTRGLYEFTMQKGDNNVSIVFDVDRETLGSLSEIYQEAVDKDWTSLFSVNSIMRIISWLFEGGILVAALRYFVKDKALEKKLEENVKRIIETKLNESMKNSVLDATKEILLPMEAENEKRIIGVENALNTIARCFALSQQGDSESKMAILKELSGLDKEDKLRINTIMDYVNKMIEEQNRKHEEALKRLESIEKSNSESVEGKPIETVEETNEDGYDGTAI